MVTTSSRPHVVLLEPIHADGISLLERDAHVTVLDGSTGKRAQALATAEVLIVRSTRVDAELLDLAPSLRVLGRHGAGLDTIDLEACESRGITVVNTPRSNTDSVAEHVVTVLLMLFKRISATEAALRSGSFSASAGSLPGQVVRAGLVGREVAGAVLGVVGAGAIGRAVAQRARALGMTVVAVDPFLPPAARASFPGDVVDTLHELLIASDAVSLHIPGTPGAPPVIGAAQLALMRPDAVLINAARGSIVDDEALAAALHDGSLAGAAVDVFDPEPPEPEHPLLTAPNLIATPHSAAMTAQALQRMAVDVARAALAAYDAPQTEENHS